MVVKTPDPSTCAPTYYFVSNRWAAEKMVFLTAEMTVSHRVVSGLHAEYGV
jgi:hypothetical protein